MKSSLRIFSGEQRCNSGERFGAVGIKDEPANMSTNQLLQREQFYRGRGKFSFRGEKVIHLTTQLKK